MAAKLTLKADALASVTGAENCQLDPATCGEHYFAGNVEVATAYHAANANACHGFLGFREDKFRLVHIAQVKTRNSGSAPVASQISDVSGSFLVADRFPVLDILLLDRPLDAWRSVIAVLLRVGLVLGIVVMVVVAISAVGLNCVDDAAGD